MADKIRIYPGDTVPQEYECRKRDANDPRNSAGLPVTPTNAYFRLLNRASGEFAEIGGPGDTTVDAEITPQTGNTWSDTGALVRYTLPAEFTQEPGDYVLLMTAIFGDGAILTEDQFVKVLEFR